MLYVPFRHVTTQIVSHSQTPMYLQSGNVPASLEDDIRRLTEQDEDNNETEDEVHIVNFLLHSN